MNDTTNTGSDQNQSTEVNQTETGEGNNTQNLQQEQQQEIVDFKIGNADEGKQTPSQGVDDNKPTDDADQADKEKQEVPKFEKTGDTGLDVALDFASKHGYSPDHPFIIEASNGNWDLLEADLASKNIPGADKYIELAKKGWNNLIENEKKTAQETYSAVLSVVDNDVNMLNQIQAFASQNASQSEKDQINAMLDAGPLQARAAMFMLRQAYEQATGTVIKPASAIKENSYVDNPGRGGSLSRAEYTQAVTDLANRIGSHNLQNSPEYKALTQRRLASMKAEGSL